MTGPQNPVPPAVADHWQALLDDATETAAEYRTGGWDALVVHTAEVDVRTDDQYGLELVAPDNEFAAVASVVDGTAFDESHVYRTDADGVRFLLVVAEATAVDQAVLLPAYLPLEETAALAQRAQEGGRMFTHVRTISDEERVTFTHDDPAPFFG